MNRLNVDVAQYFETVWVLFVKYLLPFTRVDPLPNPVSVV